MHVRQGGSAPSEEGWSGANVVHESDGWSRLGGAYIGFTGSCYLRMDDLTIRSDADGDGDFEPGEEELVEDFTIDADGYASRRPAYDAAGNLTYDEL